jgi:adenylate cyclase
MPPSSEQEIEHTRDVWRHYLTGDEQVFEGTERVFRLVLGHLPSDPRCRICQAPFRGVGRAVARSLGFSPSPSQMNPTLCNRCERFVRKYEVGVEIELTLLFADVRGSTALAERLGAAEFHRLIDRFYRVAAQVLVDHDALVDKLVGDEAIGLFVPGIAGPEYARRAVLAAQQLLEAVGHASPEGPWVQLGAGVHTGHAYVGSVGSDHTVGGITVLGDAANTAARLASAAGPGEVLVSEATMTRAGLDLDGCEQRALDLKGVSAPVPVRVLLPHVLVA